MHYPIILNRIFADLALYVPDSPQVKSIYEKLRASDPETAFPFWAKTWPSAYELATFLKEEPEWTQGKQVLELGAGTALPSFATAHLAAGMIISDHSSEAVELMEKNIDLLGLHHVKAMLLDWNLFPQNIKTDVLLLSDINYAADQFNALTDLIKYFLLDGTTVILSTPQRINIIPFAEALQSFITRSELRVNNNNGEDVEIRILILSK